MTKKCTTCKENEQKDFHLKQKKRIEETIAFESNGKHTHILDLNHSKVQPHIHLHVFQVKNCHKIKTAYEKATKKYSSFGKLSCNHKKYLSKKNINTVLLQQKVQHNSLSHISTIIKNTK